MPSGTESTAPAALARTTGELSVCAIIVTYKPGPAVEENIAAIAAQVREVVIVDNGSGEDTAQMLHDLANRIGCVVLRNRQNLGIAAALNRGLSYALEAGCDWVCTFDQDSRIGDGFFIKMLDVYEHALQPELVSIVAPIYVDKETGVEVRLRRTRSGEILAAMTSGSLVPARVIRRLGFFEETLFIDAVDKEYCLRARRNGLRILQSDARLTHSLGQTTRHRLLGLSFGATNHSVGRRYYIARNSLWVLLRYADDWKWAWREGQWMLLDAAKIFLVEKNKWKKLRAMAKGMADALSGKMGKQIEL